MNIPEALIVMSLPWKMKEFFDGLIELFNKKGEKQYGKASENPERYCPLTDTSHRAFPTI